jgi:hypothetical protein
MIRLAETDSILIPQITDSPLERRMRKLAIWGVYIVHTVVTLGDAAELSSLWAAETCACGLDSVIGWGGCPRKIT